MGFKGGPCCLCGRFSPKHSADWFQGKNVPRCPVLEGNLCHYYLKARPALEACGVDVFATGKKVGWTKYLVVFDPRAQKILAVWAAAVAGLEAYGLLVADWGWMTILGWVLVSLAVALLVGLDLTGSTPLYKSALHEDRLLTVALDADRCQGRAICHEVCPKGCFEVDSKGHKASIISESECVQCGACIVQCPEDALAFVDGNGRRIPPDELRRYKVNLLGERARAT